MAASEDVPVARLAAVARALGIEPPPERARFIAEVTRFANQIPLERRRLASGLAIRDDEAAEGAPADPSELVPIPLTTAVWGDAVFRRRLQPSELVSSIIADREAALLCHGLAGLDDETLLYLGEHPGVVSFLYQRAAPVFAAFASSLRIRRGRVVTPGGDEAVPLWEAAVGENVTRPDRFVRALFSRSEGRVAYLYDGIAHLDASHAAFAMGVWMPAPQRWSRFNALLTFARQRFSEWKLKVLPFSRPVYDVVSLLMRVQVGPDGTPSEPASRTLWARALASDSLAREASPAAAGDGHVDGAWLAERLLGGEYRERGERLDQFSFGQRVFHGAPAGSRADVLTSLRAFARYPMLLLTLDRMGITDPAVHAAAARHASRLTALDRRHGPGALAQFQSTVALIARLRLVRAIDAPRAGALMASLAAVPLAEDGYRGRLLEWWDRELRPGASGAGEVESVLLEELAGAGRAPAPPASIAWEGESYRLDLAAAEARRLRMIRDRQNSLPLDLALGVASVVRGLSSDPPALDRQAALAALRASADTLARRDPDSGENAFRQTVDDVLVELSRASRTANPRALARIVDPLGPVADAMAADALLSIAYAVDLGDPEGPVVRAGNVARRHDFGQDLFDTAARARLAWAMPTQEAAPGVPWHIAGSALGLDLALAPLGLRRVDTTRVGEAPRLTSNDRQIFALSVALLNPFTMTDGDRDALVDAIARGTARVRGMTDASFEGVADAIRLDGWRRREVRWSIGHAPDRLTSFFSLTELMHLGGAPPGAARDAWGMPAIASAGCVCARSTAPGEWWNLTGRPQLGLLATAVADVNLRVAVALRELGLPAGIARFVLSAAVQDYIDEVRPNDKDDWLTLVRTAQFITRERIEDYVAAVTADGPLMPETSPGR